MDNDQMDWDDDDDFYRINSQVIINSTPSPYNKKNKSTVTLPQHYNTYFIGMCYNMA
jgi:hypothetical protein